MAFKALRIIARAYNGSPEIAEREWRLNLPAGSEGTFRDVPVIQITEILGWRARKLSRSGEKYLHEREE